jgi:hypothetical protein
VAPAGRERQRPAGRDAEQLPVGVEHVEQGEEVVLVGSTAVQEHERALRLPTRRWADAVGEPVERHDRRASVRVSGSGVSTPARRSRKCSYAGGRASLSPRVSSGSSTANPGPSVAISNRTPLGSRK